MLVRPAGAGASCDGGDDGGLGGEGGADGKGSAGAFLGWVAAFFAVAFFVAAFLAAGAFAAAFFFAGAFFAADFFAATFFAVFFLDVFFLAVFFLADAEALEARFVGADKVRAVFRGPPRKCAKRASRGKPHQSRAQRTRKPSPSVCAHPAFVANRGGRGGETSF